MKRPGRLKPKTSKQITFQELLKLALAGIAGVGSSAYADTGLIGGLDSSGAYSAFVSSPDGTVTPIPDLPASGSIKSVSINNSNIGLIGGKDGSNNGYAALVSSGGVTSIPISVPSGEILSVSINSSNSGLIGGQANSQSNAYAAQIGPDGSITRVLTLSTTSAFIQSVSLNDNGIGLIGGEGDGSLQYAAYIAADGTELVLTTPGDAPSHITSVAINNSGNGIIGGTLGYNSAYAAFTTNGQSSLQDLSNSLSGHFIHSVAINQSGAALIGGVDGANVTAFFSDSNGNVTPLLEGSFTGEILTVAINDAGAGIIGGESSSNLYAALVQNGTTLVPLFNDPISGVINWVAINQAGVGLIGGEASGAGYAALVAPNGNLTPLNLPNVNTINSVAINTILDDVVPSSFGSSANAIYGQLAAASVLGERFLQLNKIWTQPSGSATTARRHIGNDEDLVASRDLALGPKKKATPKVPEETPPNQPKKPHSIWISPFGNYVHLKEQGATPNLNNTIGGALLGYDYDAESYVLGGSIGYAFNYIHYGSSLGHSKIQEELVSIYGAYYADHFWMDATLWGGLYQFWNVRHTLSMITSKAMTHGWILAPHIEMASPWAMDHCNRYYIEPFFMLDWVNAWQNSFTEHGPSGFNLEMPSHYGSLLQSEVGLRFYEKFPFCWGDFCLEEKISYVNQAPFHFDTATTSFVASSATFPIAVGNTTVQNLGCAQIMALFLPADKSKPYGGFALQAMVGSSYQSYFGNLFTGFDF